MEKRSRQRVRDQVGLRGRVANEIERARISMMARNTNVPFKGRIQKRKTHDPQIVTFGLQRAAGPYRWASTRRAEAAAVGSKSWPSVRTCLETQG